jgi:threonine/homoserine/homoserine lactone efflux protein
VSVAPLDIFLTAFAIGFSGAMMPGPLLAYVVDAAARRGARAGPLTMLGHALLEAVLVAALALGAARVLNVPWLLAPVALFGGTMLLWMGAGMVRQAPKLSLSAETANRRLHPVAAGVLISLANPYWTLWWVSVGAAYVLVAAQRGGAGVAIFFGGHILSDLVWYSAVSGAVAAGRRVMSDRVYRALVLACGGLLLLFGARFIGRGLGCL